MRSMHQVHACSSSRVVENAVVVMQCNMVFFPFSLRSYIYIDICVPIKVVRVIIVSPNICKVRESQVDGREERNVVYIPKCRY